MSQTNDFRSAIRQAELDRSLNGAGLIFFELAVIACGAGIFCGSALLGLLVFFVLLLILGAVSTSKLAVTVTLTVVFAAYASFFFAALYAFSTPPTDPHNAAVELIITGIISLALASIPTVYHHGAFRTLDDVSQN